MSTDDVAIRVKELVKIFPGPDGGQLRAVDGISFDVHTGEKFGFLGPNGAGKTTTLEMIEGIKPPTSGSATVLGFDIVESAARLKPLIGVQLQSANFFKELQLKELLELFGSFYGLKVDAVALLKEVGLDEKALAKVSDISGGQKRRFSIAASLVNDPEVLFLDEPTSGLDPQARRLLWELVEQVSASGKTIVLTTHYMDEAEALCDRVAVIDNGKIVALDTPLALIQSLDSAYHYRFLTSAPVPTARLESLPGARQLTSKPAGGLTRYDLAVRDSAESLGEFDSVMKRAGVKMIDFRIEPSTLEDVFLVLTGKELRD
ncbi:MAG: ABC transporter ATP-binding protein [Actinomycetota bacterium]|nr:ABC transporter ATP-binding protein [Actinomycetota bacterium]